MAETSEERLARLDAELAAQLEADRIERADAELAQMFGTPEVATPAPGPVRGEGAFAKFRREERERKAAADAATQADIEAVEADELASTGFLKDSVAPATNALRNTRNRLDLAIEGSDELQRMKNAQSTDSNN